MELILIKIQEHMMSKIDPNRWEKYDEKSKRQKIKKKKIKKKKGFKPKKQSDYRKKSDRKKY
tara:strand:- start:262 stop:447 length:186 start_codon:yes stop_codon:yes gene_type:complete